MDQYEEKKRIFFLEKGHVRQYLNTELGEEATLTIYKPGAFFPMAWVNDTFVNTYAFQAMDDVSVRIAPYARVLAFVRAENDVLFDLLKRVYRGMDGILTQKEQLMVGSARQRLVHILATLKKRGISLKFTHQELAALTGLTRETVSRQMARMKKSQSV